MKTTLFSNQSSWPLHSFNTRIPSCSTFFLSTSFITLKPRIIIASLFIFYLKNHSACFMTHPRACLFFPFCDVISQSVKKAFPSQRFHLKSFLSEFWEFPPVDSLFQETKKNTKSILKSVSVFNIFVGFRTNEHDRFRQVLLMPSKKST